jgi:hypothetical protein
MTVRGSPVTLSAAAVLAAACLPAPLQGQVQLQGQVPVQGQVQVVIEGEGAIEVRGNAVVVPGVAQPFGGESSAGIDPWWGDDAAADPPAAEVQAEGRQQAQVRLAQARRARAQTVLVRELSRVREACPGLEPAQRAAVLAAGKSMVEDQAAGRAPLANGIEPVLERALEQAAGPEVAVVYAEEVASRVARQKAAAIAVFVEAIDRDALLDASQRRKVAAALAERWQPEWQVVAATALRQRITFARLPLAVREAVSAELDPETVSAWWARAVEAPK